MMNNCQMEERTFTIESVNGYKIIHNKKPLWKDRQKITLKLIRKIGGIETEKEEYIFHRNFDMVKDKNSNKYILSWGKFFIRKFNKDWNIVLRFGKEGQGPGEIEWPMCLSSDSQDNIYIFDSRSGTRATVYSPDGEHLKDIKLPGRCQKMIILNSGDYVLDTLDLNKEVNPTIMAVVSNEGKIIKRFCAAKDYGIPSLTYNANQVYFTNDNKDNIYIAFENQNRIEKYSSSGDLIYRVEQPLDYSIINKMTLQGEQRWPELTYVNIDIKIDSKERLWVTTFKDLPEKRGSRSQTLENQDNLEFRIYSKDGIWLDRIPVPVPHFKKRIYGNRIYLIDPYFETCIYEYEIIEIYIGEKKDNTFARQ
ncbi:MAG: hypothetical protein R6U96_03730 [Promethearchaeia archaeon]